VILENPLRVGLARTCATEPCAVVIFGASGDLTWRKLCPALFRLAEESLIPREFAILGVSRTPLSDGEFRERLRRGLPQETDPSLWEAFSSRIHYHTGDHRDPQGYAALQERLEELDERYGIGGNRLFYLAVSPADFPIIAANLAAREMNRPARGWVRILVEKPFGRDLASAMELNGELLRHFDESQIYRIDHYLGKETVQNILTFRFANGIFEPVWNRRYIDHVQITAAETLGVESRGGYYDAAGALRDMIQNHLMQLLALVAMEPPARLDAEAVRDEKVKVFRAMRRYKTREVPGCAVRGQYAAGHIEGTAVPGYRQEAKVRPDSQTETYAAVRFLVDNWRWSGVPFYVRTGKRMPRKVTEVAVQFRAVPHLLFSNTPEDALEPNLLVLKIDPEEGISLRIATKYPGMVTRVRWVNMDFQYGRAFAAPSPAAYERLLLDSMLGDATLFSRGDAVEAAWAVVDPILEAWKSGPGSTDVYPAGSWGPRAAEAFVEDEGRHWRRI
jgi:glucose-6-phosphate 1-dehydrogenase